jgi:hypothetical protein
MVTPQTRLVLVEGIHLLHDDGLWSANRLEFLGFISHKKMQNLPLIVCIFTRNFPWNQALQHRSELHGALHCCIHLDTSRSNFKQFIVATMYD